MFGDVNYSYRLFLLSVCLRVRIEHCFGQKCGLIGFCFKNIYHQQQQFLFTFLTSCCMHIFKKKYSFVCWLFCPARFCHIGKFVEYINTIVGHTFYCLQFVSVQITRVRLIKKTDNKIQRIYIQQLLSYCWRSSEYDACQNRNTSKSKSDEFV